MRTAAQLFYLAVFALLGPSHGSSSSDAATKSKDAGPNVCAYEPNALVSDACASYQTLEDINAIVHPYLKSLTRNTDFFSYYRLNLYNKKCPFWSDEDGMCGNIACAVNTLDNEEDIPLVWRANELGKLEGPKAEHPGRKQQQERPAEAPLQGGLGQNVGESCVLEYDDECDDRDYCVPEDERASAKGDYVSLVGNPERFTGYAGAGARQVWEAIYRENCFSTPPPSPNDLESAAGQSSSFSGGFSNPQQFQAAQDLRSIMKSAGAQQGFQNALAYGSGGTVMTDDGLEFEDSCLEKRVFYRVISGMHTSINTHLCWDYLNQTTGEWGPNLECYINRLHTHPERLSNIYFNYALLLRAAGKMRQHLRDYQFCSADPEQDEFTRELVLVLADAMPSGPQIFDESVMFHDPGTVDLKEDFRNRFRNVSRIMDCVGCDKCRLWGKLQTAGYGTAMKILFEFDELDSSNDPPLRRHELVALINTLDKVSHSLVAIQEFRRMVEEKEAAEALQIPASAAAEKPTAAASAPGKQPAGQENQAPPEQEDDGLPDFKRKPKRQPETISEIFWEEVGLVWRMYKYVLRSWFEFPGKALKICIAETSRLWDYWLGLPVRPRSWEVRLPRREEL